MKTFSEPGVAAVFAAAPSHVRRRLLALRALIFATAAKTEGVGELEETLKWGEPAYLTSETKSGSTIRIGWKESRPTEYALYFNCQSGLVSQFRERFPRGLRFEGKRAIVFRQSESLPRAAVSQCISLALTHRSAKRKSPKRSRLGGRIGAKKRE